MCIVSAAQASPTRFASIITVFKQFSMSYWSERQIALPWTHSIGWTFVAMPGWSEFSNKQWFDKQNCVYTFRCVKLHIVYLQLSLHIKYLTYKKIHKLHTTNHSQSRFQDNMLNIFIDVFVSMFVCTSHTSAACPLTQGWPIRLSHLPPAEFNLRDKYWIIPSCTCTSLLILTFPTYATALSTSKTDFTCLPDPFGSQFE